MRRTRIAAVLTLAVINVFTLAAGIAVAHMLPARLAALRVPVVAPEPVSSGRAVLAAGPGDGPLPSANGLRAALSGPLSAAALGPGVSAVVADPVTGRVLMSEQGSRPMTPASTTKLATGLTALAVLGGDARLTTRVVRGAASEQHHPGRRRRPDPGREPVPGQRLSPARHAGRPGRLDGPCAQSAGAANGGPGL